MRPSFSAFSTGGNETKRERIYISKNTDCGDDMYKLGIDVGSTTLKAVVLDDTNTIVYKSYQRHFSKVREYALDKIRELEPVLKGKQVKAAITGSAGLGAAEMSGISFVQEVFATAGGVKRLYPKTDVVIELGGEDAKIIFLQGAMEQRMNSTCAGGTGAFIDQMASLLNVSLEELDQLSQKHTDIYPIASRCGVFAKTDIQPLINQGAKKENIAASIFQAVVDQTIVGLAQGRPISGNVLFLGGPLAFLKGLRERFVETLKLSPDQAVFPELAPYFVALGSAFYAENLEESYNYTQLLTKFEMLNEAELKPEGLSPLFLDEQDYERFVQRHNQSNVAVRDITSYEGPAALGIDAGSTTTKLVLLDPDNNILYSHYCSNLGNPLHVVLEQLKKIYELCGSRVNITASAVTGYGEELIQNAFDIDIGVVETIAHYTAARYFNPKVDFIIDIGGQDIKCFQIKDGAIDSVMLNEACSSGCGSFIETFAHSLGYEIEEFAKLGLFAKCPVDLGTRCTVFMNSSVKQAQKNGASVGDISAGLATSVVKNALYKVIRARSADELGYNVVVQGGTFLNDAVLKSFENVIGKQVTRPGISGLMGAFGAALYARENMDGKSSGIITPDKLNSFSHTSKMAVCGLCTNQCSLTINTFDNGKKFIMGNRCERPIKGAGAKNLPNLYRYKLDKLTSMSGKPGKRGKIGLPLVLNFYENLPFWHTFFTSLGFEVVVSDKSSRSIYIKGQQTIPSDTVCYPAKLVHGHIFNLLEKGVETIFYPCQTYNFDEKISDNHFNCPIVAYYPELIEANIPQLEKVQFLYPYVTLNNKSVFIKNMQKYLSVLNQNITRAEIKRAANEAFTAYRLHREDIINQGEKAMQFAKDNHLKTIVLAGRPYHADPEINHGIDQLISTLGFVILSEDAIPPVGYRKRNVLNQWTYHARMYNAADYVCGQKDMELVQLVSFGCGLDAITTDEVSEILRSSGKLYTQIKIDEINNLGAVKIRIRSLLAAMKEREKINE